MGLSAALQNQSTLRSPAGLGHAVPYAVEPAGNQRPSIAVVIPCYRVKAHVLDVIRAIGPEVDHIIAVDDHCPEQSGRLVESANVDPRVTVVFHETNKGVGGAVVSGYVEALKRGATIVVKVDGDGQMDPALIPNFVAPILDGEADYTKGNRFHSLYFVQRMPRARLFGNAMLSFLTKLSSGYWTVFDPTNGYTAVHRAALQAIDLHKLSQRYFFESDMLIKLGDVRAVVVDVPMRAHYGDEISSLKISRILGEFLFKHVHATFRRIVYAHFLRDFSFASIGLVTGAVMLVFGLVFGGVEWHRSVSTGVAATTGAVMISVLPIVLGVQLLLFFLSYDMSAEPRRPLQWLARRH